MKHQRQALILACVAALAFGICLRVRIPAPAEPRAEDRAELDTGSKSPDWDFRSPKNEARIARRAVAKCDDASLWNWLLEPTDDLETLEIVIDELIDRRGWDALRYLMAIEEGPQRDPSLHRLYGELAARDPWKAYEIWQTHGEVLKDDAYTAFRSIIQAAGSVSAEKMVEVLQEASKTHGNYSEVTPDYTPDFDFKELLDFSCSEESRAMGGFGRPLLEWAKRSPAAAAEWCGRNFPQYLDEHERVMIYREVAQSNLEEKEMASSLRSIGEEVREVDIWTTIALSSDGKLDPALMRSAKATAGEDKYLSGVLDQTRFTETLDNSWQQVPLAQRLKAKAAVEAAWRKELAGPIHDRARERWGKMLDEASGR